MDNLAEKTFEKILDNFKKQIWREMSTYLHEAQFHRRSQGPNKDFEEFYSFLQCILRKTGIRDCCKDIKDQDSCLDRALLGRILGGLYSNELRKRVLATKDLTLARALEKIPIEESTEKSSIRISEKLDEIWVNKTSMYKNFKQVHSDVSTPFEKKKIKCKWCTYIHPYGKFFVRRAKKEQYAMSVKNLAILQVQKYVMPLIVLEDCLEPELSLMTYSFMQNANVN